MFLTVLRSVPAKGSVPAQRLAEHREASQEQSLVEKSVGTYRRSVSACLLFSCLQRVWKVGRLKPQSLKQKFLEAGNSRRDEFPSATQPVPSPGGGCRNN